MSKQNSSGSFIVGLVIGGVVGTVTGIIIAPRQGSQTRRILAKSAQALPEIVEDLSSSVQLQKNRLANSVTQNWYRLKDAIAAGIQASQSEQPQTLSTPNTHFHKEEQTHRSL